MSRYRERPRDWEFMSWVKQTRPCMWRDLSACDGPIEADHAGRRPVGRKAPDRTCVGACRGHHRQRTDMAGPFRRMAQADIRARLDAEIAQTQHDFDHRNDKPIPF